MKPVLKVHNVGPIKDINIDINRINLFIGPQSSGKSTLAKLISFCQWIEKDIVMHQGTEHINSDYICSNLVEYHKMASYFTEDSYIEYQSFLISFVYKGEENFTLKVTGDLKNAKAGKVTYIPSERNYVSIENISSLMMSYTYVRDFIFDWLLIHSKYSKSNPVDILGLVKYYYDTTRGDIIILPDGKEIKLNVASSGIQAAVPLMVFLQYGADWIFRNKLDLSFEKYELISSSVARYDSDKMGVRRSVQQNISKLHYSSFVIEEPEQNLFPSTQYALVKHIFSMLDNTRDDSLVITTHSPYIMTAVNNLILAGNIIAEGNMSEKQVLDTVGLTSYINFGDVNAFALSSGTAVSIRDEESKLLSANLIDSASEYINNDFDNLLQL
ncbi:MAG: AAA family ATPase [Bacteroidales bacterium]|nr:AAA family ATPase [Bacteroidales bacterium]